MTFDDGTPRFSRRVPSVVGRSGVEIVLPLRNTGVQPLRSQSDAEEIA